jgi:hypothetical protein
VYVIFVVLLVIEHLSIAHCDGINAFSPPLQLPEEPLIPPEAAPQPVVIPQLPEEPLTPPRVFYEIAQRCELLFLLSNRQVPPQWNMEDLLLSVLGNDSLRMPSYLQDTYDDVVLNGATSLLFEDLGNIIHLINNDP